MEKIVAIIQARMGSTRLPGKVMMDLEGRPVLHRAVTRTLRSTLVEEVVVATTTQQADEAIVEYCRHQGWSCFRGSEDDVLDRYYRAASECRADVVIRITSDCPLIEPEIVDLVVGKFLSSGDLHYASNTLPPRTFPRGLDVEAMSFAALERAWQEDNNPAWREHVTPYIYRHPEKFSLHGVYNDVDYSSWRWTVDTPEDLAFVRKVYEHLGNDGFSWRDVLRLLEEHPEWLEINRHVEQKQAPD